VGRTDGEGEAGLMKMYDHCSSTPGNAHRCFLVRNAQYSCHSFLEK